jgi:hypothetical protein
MLTPKQYMIQKSNQLPFECCFINQSWKTDGMAFITMVRVHKNGNYTYCIYLIDLQCLGVKDTHFYFNKTIDMGDIKKAPNAVKISYKLAHNIIYAGYEFALELDFNPHPEFEVTKHFLLNDEEVPLVKVHVGDEDGKPLYMPFPNEPYLHIVKKLEKNPGKGNYTFVKGEDLLNNFNNEATNMSEEQEERTDEMFAEVSNTIDHLTENMDGANALIAYRYMMEVVIQTMEKQRKKPPKHLSKEAFEQLKYESLQLTLQKLVKKYNNAYPSENPILPSNLMK